ncbi:MAG: hypothetical protein QNJ65_13350 [Xenococcaceae cyanobacterium MO_234.B1]|nr:hypothetical protein [Xenococcaceae cyanobacterium MO_234.B1]
MSARIKTIQSDSPPPQQLKKLTMLGIRKLSEEELLKFSGSSAATEDDSKVSRFSPNKPI